MTDLKGDHFLLRPWREGDVESLVRYANNRKIWRNMRDLFPHPYTHDDARQWIQLCAEKPAGEIRLAIERDGEAVGGIGYTLLKDVNSRTAEIGYWLGEPFWGKGIVTKAVRLLTDHAFATLDVMRLQAWVFAWNPASARVLEKTGFELESRMRSSAFKDGEFTDQLIYAKLRAADPC